MHAMRNAMLAAAFCFCSAASAMALDVKDVAAMLQNGVGDTAIATLARSQKLTCPLTTDDVLELNRLGISSTLLEILTRSDAALNDCPTPPPAVAVAPETVPASQPAPAATVSTPAPQVVAIVEASLPVATVEPMPELPDSVPALPEFLDDYYAMAPAAVAESAPTPAPAPAPTPIITSVPPVKATVASPGPLGVIEPPMDSRYGSQPTDAGHYGGYAAPAAQPGPAATYVAAQEDYAQQQPEIATDPYALYGYTYDGYATDGYAAAPVATAPYVQATTPQTVVVQPQSTTVVAPQTVYVNEPTYVVAYATPDVYVDIDYSVGPYYYPYDWDGGFYFYSGRRYYGRPPMGGRRDGYYGRPYMPSHGGHKPGPGGFGPGNRFFRGPTPPPRNGPGRSPGGAVPPGHKPPFGSAPGNKHPAPPKNGGIPFTGSVRPQGSGAAPRNGATGNWRMSVGGAPTQSVLGATRSSSTALATVAAPTRTRSYGNQPARSKNVGPANRPAVGAATPRIARQPAPAQKISRPQPPAGRGNGPAFQPRNQPGHQPNQAPRRAPPPEIRKKGDNGGPGHGSPRGLPPGDKGERGDRKGWRR